ncbi:hypothetical protein JCM5353_003201 [Sporobolomyces roseus]
MSSSDLGSCVVCGKETATRCAACAKNGIKWMHFCSREHQKLIYFVHKRVCGSNPFRWPGFSETEILQYLDVSDVPIDLQRGPPASILSGLKPHFARILPPAARDDKTAQKGVLRHILEKYKERDASHPLSSAESNRSAEFRGMQYTARGRSAALLKDPTGASSIGRVDGRENVEENPINYLVGFEDGLIDKFSTSDHQNESWWTNFQHRYLISMTLVNRLSHSPGSDDLAAQLRYSQEQVKRVLREEVEPLQPRVAHTFRDNMIPTLSMTLNC